MTCPSQHAFGIESTVCGNSYKQYNFEKSTNDQEGNQIFKENVQKGCRVKHGYGLAPTSNPSRIVLLAQTQINSIYNFLYYDSFSFIFQENLKNARGISTCIKIILFCFPFPMKLTFSKRTMPDSFHSKPPERPERTKIWKPHFIKTIDKK